MQNYDVVIIGAGSVGCPTALELAERGLSVLVLDGNASAGQGQNKAAIGGVRATHSDPAKIALCGQSLELFSTFHERYGIDIGWKQGGYCFPAFGDSVEGTLKKILPGQQGAGLDIDWISPEEVAERVPGIVTEDLRGGTFSPGDGQVSPLMATNAFQRAAEQSGAVFRYRERVVGIEGSGGHVSAVVTDQGSYGCETVIIAAGAKARQVGAMVGLDLPVTPDSHEAGISGPVEQFLDPLVVDIRPGPEGRTANFYFGQNSEGQIIFCYTPVELFVGTDREATSEFMPVVASRLVGLVPRLKNLLVRRTWRGLYPMTPDGLPIVDQVDSPAGLYLAVGMCGQGFMLGPGVAKTVAGLILDNAPAIDEAAFETIRFERDYGAADEALK